MLAQVIILNKKYKRST
jgi:hypothetical protein